MTYLVGTRAGLGEAFGADALHFDSVDDLGDRLSTETGPRTVVLGPDVLTAEAVRLAGSLRLVRPEVGFVLLRSSVDAGVLSEAARHGIREVVQAGDQDALMAAVRRSDDLGAVLARRSVPSPPSPVTLGKVVTVFSAKGGCGKTTMSTNLGAALADGGRRRVVVVDLDLTFGDVAIALQLFPTRTIADAVPLGEEGLDAAGLLALLTPHSPGLSTLVAPVEPGASDTVQPSLVTRIIQLLRENFDHVVIDTPPAFDDQVLAAFDLSDVVVLMATLDVPALKNLKLALETLHLLDYPRDRLKIVINRSDSKVGLAMAEVEQTLRTTVTAQVPSSRDVPASINRGVPIVLDDPRHPVSVAIREFAERELTTGVPVARPDAPARPRRRLLRRR